MLLTLLLLLDDRVLIVCRGCHGHRVIVPLIVVHTEQVDKVALAHRGRHLGLHDCLLVVVLAGVGHSHGEHIQIICEQLRPGAAILYHFTAIVVTSCVTYTAQLERERDGLLTVIFLIIRALRHEQK